MPKNKTTARNDNSDSVRLNKFIADSGLCSRRKADALIEEGAVSINGKKVYEHGIKVNAKEDRVLVNGKPIATTDQLVYYMINKPKNVMTTMDDPLDRPKIGDYIKKEKHRIFPVGRLDWDSEGLLIMTNDGAFAQAVAHPKKEIPKTYMVKLNGQPEEYKLKKLKTGVTIVGGRVSAKYIERVRMGSSDKYDWYKVVITQGKNRQIRRMFEKIGFDVTKLQRVAIGTLSLGKLKRGDYKKLTPKDLEKVFKTMDFEEKTTLKPKANAQKKTAHKKTKGSSRTSSKPSSRRSSKTQK